MVARRQAPTKPIYAEEFEEHTGNSKLGRILTSVALYGVMALLIYIVFAPPESGTGMGPIRDVLCGLGGSLSILIPIMLGWLATLVALSATSKKIPVWKSIFDGFLFVLVFTIGQLTVAETVIHDRMTISGFANFVDKSYTFGRGGGAIGALLAWPLYSYVGKIGGIFVSLLLALLSLTATGRTIRFTNWLRERTEEVQHDSQQRRMVRDNERMFDIVEEEPVRTERPVRRQRPADPAADSMYIPSHREQQRPAQPRRTTAAGEELRRPRRAPGADLNAFEQADLNHKKPARPVKKPVAPVQAEEEESLIDDAPFGTVGGMPLDDSPSMAAFDGSRRKKREKAAEHQPDAPQSVLKKARAKAETSEEEAEILRKTKAKENQISMEDEDLTIEPEPCDVLAGDEPVSPRTGKDKKPLSKLKRPTPPPEDTEEEEMYNYPPIDLLEVSEGITENHRETDMQKARLLEETLQQFGIQSKLTGIAHGPAVTRYELQPAPGVKVSRITSLADDIAMHLAAMSVRIEAPIPGKAAVGVEIPNEKVEMVRLRDVLESAEARKSASKIAVGLGKDNSGRYIVADIAKMPHVLIAGQTGSGKSVCINSIITSILFRATPDEVKMILIDPKMVELSIYNDIPHLICPVVTDCKKAASALDWAVAEMSSRYKKFAERGVRDIKGYNKALPEGEKMMPQMVIIIDELADLMMVAPGEVEDSICRLAQLARAAGMHLVIATQRPSVNVITGIIKANIPTRIAFSVASQVDSRTMIDHGGAEKLLGNGDMLFVPSGINKPMRVQGAWVSDEEVHAIVSYIKERSETAYDEDMIEKMDNAARTDAEKEEFNAEYDPRLPEAVEIVVEAGQASVSMLQRRMRVGYARAGRLIDEMEQRGIVSEADGAKPRTVLITREEMADLFED